MVGSRQWSDEISAGFQTSLTVSLHSPNGKQMPTIRDVQGDRESVYDLWYSRPDIG